MKLVKLLRNVLGENLTDLDHKQKLLYDFWDNKGLKSTPIYHYLGLDPKNRDDRKKIFNYKVDYLGGLEGVREKILTEITIGKPVKIDIGGYDLDYIVTDFNIEINNPDEHPYGSSDGEIYYEINGSINGETSYVELMTDGNTYNIGDLFKGNVDLDSGTIEEIRYEISDVIREYFDKITDKYGALGDMIDYNVVNSKEFQNNIVK